MWHSMEALLTKIKQKRVAMIFIWLRGSQLVTLVKCLSPALAVTVGGSETGRCRESVLVAVRSTLFPLDADPDRLNIPVIRLERSFLLEFGSPVVDKSVSLP